MNIVATIARMLMGLIFLIFGLNGFLLFIPSPPITGMIADFSSVLFHSHYIWFTAAVQVIVGILLLIHRYVLLAIVAIAALLSNILTLHITMQPAGLPMPLFVTLLWIIVAIQYRKSFATLLAAKPEMKGT